MINNATSVIIISVSGPKNLILKSLKLIFSRVNVCTCSEKHVFSLSLCYAINVSILVKEFKSKVLIAYVQLYEWIQTHKYCGLHNLGFEFRQGARGFLLLQNVQTGSGVHSDSHFSKGRGSFPGGKAVGTWRWPLTNTTKQPQKPRTEKSLVGAEAVSCSKIWLKRVKYTDQLRQATA